MEAILEGMPNIGDVTVSRTESDTPFTGGYTWSITFLSDDSDSMERPQLCGEGQPPSCPSPGNVPGLGLALSASKPLQATGLRTAVTEAARGNVASGFVNLTLSGPLGAGQSSGLVPLDATAEDMKTAL